MALGKIGGSHEARWLLAGTSALIAGGQVLASDLPPPAAAPPPPPSRVHSSGFVGRGVYFGFNLGYGFGTSNWTDPVDPGGATGYFNLTGFLTGATIGANFQTDPFVFGAEADFDGSFIDGKKSSPFCNTGTQCETKNTWFSTLRARIGVGAADGALGDVAAGAKRELPTYDKRRCRPGSSLYREPDRPDRISPVAALPLAAATSACPVTAQTDTVKFSTSMIRLGVDYKFH